MNIKIIEKSLLPLFLAAIFIVAYTWQFTHVYAFLIEHFKDEKLSFLYAHLFIYAFLIFTVFLFIMNFFNILIKSPVFITIIVISLFTFHTFTYETFLNSSQYFINYPLSVNETMLLILFIVTTIIYGIYTVGILFFNTFIPFSHSFVFLIIALSYSAWFINSYAYPISEILTKFA